MPFAPASGFPMGTSIGCGPGCTAVCGSCRHLCGSPTEWPRPTAPIGGGGFALPANEVDAAAAGFDVYLPMWPQDLPHGFAKARQPHAPVAVVRGRQLLKGPLHGAQTKTCGT